ncbi:MAG: hypothetical protein U5L45_09640 [Saprospiraceae bacterium]|nr:hypothetical protein [Saprospiraceae bacterium]
MLAQRQKNRWFVFRQSRKTNHIPLSARAKRACGKQLRKIA